jgi:hypothetical protein
MRPRPLPPLATIESKKRDDALCRLAASGFESRINESFLSVLFSFVPDFFPFLFSFFSLHEARMTPTLPGKDLAEALERMAESCKILASAISKCTDELKSLETHRAVKPDTSRPRLIGTSRNDVAMPPSES